MPRPGSVAWRCDSRVAISGACAMGQHTERVASRHLGEPCDVPCAGSSCRDLKSHRRTSIDSLRDDRLGADFVISLKGRGVSAVASKRSSQMASARIRERTKARQSAARKAGIRKAPRKTLHGKLLQLPSSPRSTVKRRGQHGSALSSPASRPKQVKTRSLVTRWPSPHVCFLSL